MLGDGRVTATRRAALALLALCAGSCKGDDAGSRGESGAASASVAERSAQRCDAANASLIIDSLGIGPVLRGARIGALVSRCSVADTALALSEGTPERAHVVTIGGRQLVVLSTGTPDTSIIRVITVDQGFRTSGGVGVGSSVQSLRLAHGRICAARGEGDFVVMASELPGVSFAIDWNPPPTRDPSSSDTPFPGGDPGTALDAARITKLWVHGVSGACRVGVG
jgi:hypothetical protein